MVTRVPPNAHAIVKHEPHHPTVRNLTQFVSQHAQVTERRAEETLA
jgi:hypothetical protein